MLPLLTTTCTAFHAPATAVHAGSCVPPTRHAAAICSSTGSAGPLIRSAFLSLIAGQSAFALATEVPSLFSSSPDIFGTLFDAGFLFYSGRLLAGQAGLVGGDEALAEKLAGLDCTCTLSIGREPGTWMPKEWGSSGARLSLPLQLRFSEETADLGFPGEESMTGRTARQLCCPGGGSFVGQAGTVRVEPTGGAWSVKPTRQPGVGELRFFLDFPTEAARNDVTLPAGRVFFSGTCVDPELAQALGPTPGDVFVAPGSGVRLFGEGGVTTKRTDARNLYGALGETFLILGRFSLGPPPPPQASEDETPQQRAARERAEDEARGRAV